MTSGRERDLARSSAGRLRSEGRLTEASIFLLGVDQQRDVGICLVPLLDERRVRVQAVRDVPGCGVAARKAELGDCMEGRKRIGTAMIENPLEFDGGAITVVHHQV